MYTCIWVYIYFFCGSFEIVKKYNARKFTNNIKYYIIKGFDGIKVGKAVSTVEINEKNKKLCTIIYLVFIYGTSFREHLMKNYIAPDELSIASHSIT